MATLAIDIGNTQTALGVFRAKKLVGTLHVPSTIRSSIKKVRGQIKRLLQQTRISPDAISGAVISSVVPDLTKKFSIAVKQHVQIDPLIVSGILNVGLRIRYDNPKALGADRLCNAVAAFEKYGGPIIVIDAGTATTFDVIAKNGTFLGGAIAPGIKTAALAIHRQTAQLPNIDLVFPKHVIGKNTCENIQSGILYGAIDAMEGMIKRIKVITGEQTNVVLTGGFSHLIKAKTSIAVHVVPSLVLQGARLIYERVHRTKK